MFCKLHYNPTCFMFLQISPNCDFVNNTHYSQNFLKLWYGSKLYNTFQRDSFHNAYWFQNVFNLIQNLKNTQVHKILIL